LLLSELCEGKTPLVESLIMDLVTLVIFAFVFALWTQSTLGQGNPELEQPTHSAEEAFLMALGKLLSKDSEN
jgi:hypothetical protein